METLKLVWSRHDAIDTAQAFHAEMEHAEIGAAYREQKPRWTAKLFGRSRFRRARIYDGLAVGLLMTLMAALGVVVFAASAKADPSSELEPEVIAYTARNAGIVCSVLADHPSVAGLEGIMLAIEDNGLTPRQAGQVAALSVYEACPRYAYILDAFVAVYGPKGAVA